MRLFSRVLASLLVFCIDIQVKAEEAKPINSEKEVIVREEKNQKMNLRMEPPHCLSNVEVVCYLRVEGNAPGHLHFAGGEIHFSKRSIVARKSESHLRLVKGYGVVMAKDSFTIETRYGDILLKAKDIVLVELFMDRVEVTAISGGPQLVMLGGQEKLLLPMPYQNWMGAMQRNGQPRGGRPRPGNFANWLKMWGRVSPDKDLVRQKAAEFRPLWKEAVFSTGGRDIAAAEDHQTKRDLQRHSEVLRRQRIVEENRKLRRLFIEKTFEEEISSF